METSIPLPSELEFLKWMLPLIFILSVWELVWKGIALWKCGRRNQMGWFCFILIFNTVGILPIIYLLLNKDKTYQ